MTHPAPSAVDVDALLTAPAIVLGSLPPAGRDLDLLVRSDEVEALERALEAAGWRGRGHEWVRFAGGTAYAVEVVALERRLPTAAAVRELVAEAVPVPGYTHLRAPAHAHRLLLLAQRLRFGLVVDTARAERLREYDAEDWREAERCAPRWGLVAALGDLRHGLAHPVPQPARPPRRRRPVIALSGLDGAGKSTQAEHLARALAALGEDVVVEWNKVGRDRTLDLVAAPAKALVKAATAVRRGRSPDPGSDPGPDPDVDHEPAADDDEVRRHPDGPRPPAGPATRLRERSAVLTWWWTCVVAIANALTHRRTVARNRGAVVVCDRYVLDTAAHLRYRYGRERRFRVQRALNRLLSPPTLLGLFLDVTPAEARRRKQEQYTTRDLTELRRLYLAEADAAGVVVVDAGREELQVAAEVAERAWRQLHRRSRLGTARAALRGRLGRGRLSGRDAGWPAA